MRLHKYLNEMGKSLVIEYSVKKGKKCPEELEELFKTMEYTLLRITRGEDNEE